MAEVDANAHSRNRSNVTPISSAYGVQADNGKRGASRSPTTALVNYVGSFSTARNRVRQSGTIKSEGRVEENRQHGEQSGHAIANSPAVDQQSSHGLLKACMQKSHRK